MGRHRPERGAQDLHVGLPSVKRRTEHRASARALTPLALSLTTAWMLGKSRIAGRERCSSASIASRRAHHPRTRAARPAVHRLRPWPLAGRRPAHGTRSRHHQHACDARTCPRQGPHPHGRKRRRRSLPQQHPGRRPQHARRNAGGHPVQATRGSTSMPRPSIMPSMPPTAIRS